MIQLNCDERAPLPAPRHIFALLVADAEQRGKTRAEGIRETVARAPDAHRTWLRAIRTNDRTWDAA